MASYSKGCMASDIVGGYIPIDDINNPGVTEITNFAITEYNKQSEAKLKFEKVIKGEAQLVEGTNYRLTLSATNGSVSNTYETKELTSFVPVHA